MVETGKIKDSFLALCVRNIWLLTASLDIEISVSHVPGIHNVIADTLSRVYSDKQVNLDLLSILQDNYIWEHNLVIILTSTLTYNFRSGSSFFSPIEDSTFQDKNSL